MFLLLINLTSNPIWYINDAEKKDYVSVDKLQFLLKFETLGSGGNTIVHITAMEIYW